MPESTVQLSTTWESILLPGCPLWLVASQIHIASASQYNKVTARVFIKIWLSVVTGYNSGTPNESGQSHTAVVIYGDTNKHVKAPIEASLVLERASLEAQLKGFSFRWSRSTEAPLKGASSALRNLEHDRRDRSVCEMGIIAACTLTCSVMISVLVVSALVTARGRKGIGEVLTDVFQHRVGVLPNGPVSVQT